MALSEKYRNRQKLIGEMRRDGKPLEIEKLVHELNNENFSHREIALLLRTNQQNVKDILTCRGNRKDYTDSFS